jgi:hypothetical protein
VWQFSTLRWRSKGVHSNAHAAARSQSDHGRHAIGTKSYLKQSTSWLMFSALPSVWCSVHTPLYWNVAGTPAATDVQAAECEQKTGCTTDSGKQETARRAQCAGGRTVVCLLHVS